MKAAAEHRSHAAQCANCSLVERCSAGQDLYKSLARLQDAYNTQLAAKRRR
ncbi:hypothetical protein OG239_42915 (plasmid) [Streptomyces sp. NBC_00868]|uniref:hypothetical protein n=1 Tax=Streptomyces sp. NBC_00868 TaxID=2903683 RepID=UPI003866B436|nr:hypothetical protein OG239_42915 [Streptomyces sp. NBC_00868]